MQPYSIDVHTRALAALDRGMPRAEVVSTFQVSLASLETISDQGQRLQARRQLCLALQWAVARHRDTHFWLVV
jgi:hypothetical protein